MKEKKLLPSSPTCLSCLALNMVNVEDFCITSVKCFHKLCLKDCRSMTELLWFSLVRILMRNETAIGALHSTISGLIGFSSIMAFMLCKVLLYLARSSALCLSWRNLLLDSFSVSFLAGWPPGKRSFRSFHHNSCSTVFGRVLGLWEMRWVQPPQWNGHFKCA